MTSFAAICVVAYLIVGWIELGSMLRADKSYRPSIGQYTFGLLSWLWFPIIKCAERGWARKDVAGRKFQHNLGLLVAAACNLSLAVFVSGRLVSNQAIRLLLIPIIYLVCIVPVLLLVTAVFDSLARPVFSFFFGNFPCKKCGRPVGGFEMVEVCSRCASQREQAIRKTASEEVDAALREMDPGFGKPIPGISKEEQEMITKAEKAARMEAEARMRRFLEGKEMIG